MLSVSMPKAATSSALVLTATKCSATAPSPRASTSHARAVRALVSVSIVVNVFEETTNSVSAGSRSATASVIAAPSTLDTKRHVRSGLGERPQRPVGHRRAEIGAADADVDDGADRPAGGAEPQPVAHSLGELAHRPEHVVDVRHDVVDRAVGADRAEHDAAIGAQGDVQHGAVLGDVDPFAAEHRVAALGDAGGAGDGEQGDEDGVVDALLGVVDAQVADGDDVALGAAGIGGEQVAEVGGRRAAR